MPVITPAYPQMCATFNITHSTMAIIQRELERGFDLTTKIRANKLAWKDLFVKHTFFTSDHKYYLAIVATSTTKEAHKVWSGFVESKVRVLVGDLDRVESVAIARPFNKGYERAHRVKNDQETEEVQNGSLAYRVKDDDGQDDAKVKENDADGKGEDKTETNPGAEQENGQPNPNVKPEPTEQKTKIEDIADASVLGTKIYTTTHYVGLELAEGKCSPPSVLCACWLFQPPGAFLVIPNLSWMTC